METDLSLNGHNLNGSIHYLYGNLDTKNNETFFSLNGNANVLLPEKSYILNVKMFMALYIQSKLRNFHFEILEITKTPKKYHLVFLN